MIEHPAMKHFRGPENYNCAQAVAKGLETTAGEHGALIVELAKCGGGKAEGGVCGALHAAKQLVRDEAVWKRLSTQFNGMAGSLVCREIRKLKRLSCQECVGVAAQAFEDAHAAVKKEKAS